MIYFQIHFLTYSRYIFNTRCHYSSALLPSTQYRGSVYFLIYFNPLNEGMKVKIKEHINLTLLSHSWVLVDFSRSETFQLKWLPFFMHRNAVTQWLFQTCHPSTLPRFTWYGDFINWRCEAPGSLQSFLCQMKAMLSDWMWGTERFSAK